MIEKMKNFKKAWRRLWPPLAPLFHHPWFDVLICIFWKILLTRHICKGTMHIYIICLLYMNLPTVA